MSFLIRLFKLSGVYERDLKTIQQAFDGIMAALNGRLSFSDNMRARWLEFTVQAPTGSNYSVAYSSASAPKAVFVAGVWKVADNSPMSITSSCSWTWSNGKIVIPWLSGLSGTEKYLVRLLVVED